jgi:hypothetical protein
MLFEAQKNKGKKVLVITLVAFFCILEILFMLLLLQPSIMGRYVRWECFRAKKRGFRADKVGKFFACLVQSYVDVCCINCLHDIQENDTHVL